MELCPRSLEKRLVNGFLCNRMFEDVLDLVGERAVRKLQHVVARHQLGERALDFGGKFDDPRLKEALGRLPAPEDEVVFYDGKLQFEIVRTDSLSIATATSSVQKGETLRQKIEEQLAKIQKLPSLIRSFFKAPSVAYIGDC